MPELDEQLRRYFDATAPPVDHEAPDRIDGEPFVVADDLTDRGIPPRIRIAVAAAALLLAGAAGFLVLRATTSSNETETADDMSGTDERSGSPRPSAVRGTHLEWEQGSVPTATGPEQLLSDGKLLYWIGESVHTSPDGFVWTRVSFDGATPSLLRRGWVGQAWAGRLTASRISAGSVEIEVIGIDGTVISSRLEPVVADDPDAGPPVELGDPIVALGSRGIVVAVGPSDPSGPFGSVPPRTVGWHSTDGREWTEIPAEGPFAGPSGLSLRITSTTQGFVAVDDGGISWSSPDGLRWTSSDSPGPSGCCERLMAWNAGALAPLPSGGAVFVDDRGFSNLALENAPSVSLFRNSFGAGEIGIAYLVEVDPDLPSFEMVYSPDGEAWEQQTLPPEIGDPYCCFFDLYGVEVAREHVVVLTNGETGLELWLGTPTAGEDP